ncbi:MAG: hypothetical protein RRC07_02720 [Anaerolineae bacterium]|nr:hypothetical protein [Anaerolineae bacterium]
MRRFFAISFLVAAIVLVFAGAALAADVTRDGITLSYPDYPLSGPALQSCEPWAEPSADTISLTGLPEGADVLVRFAWSSPYTGSPNFRPLTTYSNVTGGSLIIPVDYPADTTLWPVFDPATNERAIAVAVFVEVRADGVTTKLVSKQWWVRCLPPLDFQGCTPGYWRQEHHFDSWAGYSPADDFNSVFGVSATFDPHTLLDAVWLGGGGENALARHAVAALLNAANPDVNYFYSEAQIISGVQNAYATGDFEPFKTALDFANNAGCPLN